MSPEQKNNLIKLAIILGALMIVALVFILLAFPLYQKITATREEIKTKQAEEENLKARIESLKELEANYKTAKEKSKMIELALPNEQQMPEILVQLENIAGETGMSFTEITPASLKGTSPKAGKSSSPQIETGTSRAKGIYKAVPLTVKIAGNFSGLKNYLKAIEKNIRILDLEAISIEKSTTEKVLNISLALNAYFQP